MGDITNTLEVRDLQVDFIAGKHRSTAVRNISFDLPKGRTLGIVGESGCGKSVTATSIMRLLPKGTSQIADGSIVLDGTDLVQLSDEEMRRIRGGRISMIFQDPMTALNPVYKIGPQLIEMLQAHQQISRKDAYERSVEMLSKVGIPLPEQRMNEYPHQLSGGMRQRVMIAMALSTNPELLIADEPTTALDVTIQAQVLDLIAKLRADFGTSVLFITHDMGVIAEIADEVLVMYAGEIVEYDTVEGLFEHPMHPYTDGLLRSIPRLDENVEHLHTIRGVVPSPDEMPAGCRFSTRCEDCMEQCRLQDPPLTRLPGGKKIACWKYIQGQED